MEIRNKYFYIFKVGIISVIIYICLGTLLRISNIYNEVSPDLFDSFDLLIRLIRTLLFLGSLSIFGYLCYVGYLYYTSAFYLKFKMSIIEAFLHSFIDIARAYDKIVKLDNVEKINVDFKDKVLIIETKSINYCANVFDAFGKIEGSILNENWRIVSKPKKKFNRIQYQKQIKINNPYISNRNYIKTISSKYEKQYENVVVLTNFQKINEKNGAFMNIYELLQIVKEEKKIS